MRALWASSLAMVAAVAVAAGHQAPPDHPTFRIAVDAVSLDVVVSDRDGAIVRDLTAGDFEILQDGKPQRVTAATFVPVGVGRDRAVTRGATPSSSASESAPAPAAPIAREQVRRTIVIVVDDLGLSGQGLHALLPALRTFVDREVQSTDLVAIVRTGQSNGVAQVLTNDHTALHAAIDALRYNILSRSGPWPFGDVVQLGTGPPQLDGPVRPLSRLESLASVNLVVRAARELPGRKTVILASEGLLLSDAGGPGAAQDPRVRGALDRVVDQAARSGVVIYALDCSGLETGGLRASDDIHYVPNMTEAVGRFTTARQDGIRSAQASLALLAEQTGGFAVTNTNDLAAGLGRIGSDVRDYYVIGYVPTPDTFAPDAKRARRHTVAVKVRRPDVRVRTRTAFIGVSDAREPTATPTPAEALVRAAMSPFATATIGLTVTAVPGHSSDRGLFVRATLRLDAAQLTFSAGPVGSRTATIDLVGLAFGADGAQVHQLATGFDVTLDAGAVEETARRGLVYSVVVPIANPGGYHLRFAVRDRRTGAIGTGGGFVDVPDGTGAAPAPPRR